jgi:hypothetical protein
VNDRRRALLPPPSASSRSRRRYQHSATLRAWLDSWSGLRPVVVGRERHGYSLSLGKIHGDGWRASFYAGPMVSAAGFGVAAPPWGAVQRGGVERSCGA